MVVGASVGATALGKLWLRPLVWSCKLVEPANSVTTTARGRLNMRAAATSSGWALGEGEAAVYCVCPLIEPPVV